MRFQNKETKKLVRQRITSTKFAPAKLAQALHKKSVRDQEGLFIIEGVKELTLAVNNGVQLHSLFVHEEASLREDSKQVIDHASDVLKDVEVFEVTDRVFQSMSYRDHSGLVAVAHKHDTNLERFEVSDRAMLVICSSFEKPGNLGAVMRSADAVGAHAVIIENPTLDVFNPNVVRASIGTLFTVPIILTDFDALVSWLHHRDVAAIATSPDADANYTDYPYPERVAIVVGNEAAGLDERWFQIARDVVSIPQHGQADSLNAAMSATLVLYEVVRYRGNGSC